VVNRLLTATSLGSCSMPRQVESEPDMTTVELQSRGKTIGGRALDEPHKLLKPHTRRYHRWWAGWAATSNWQLTAGNSHANQPGVAEDRSWWSRAFAQLQMDSLAVSW